MKSFLYGAKFSIIMLAFVHPPDLKCNWIKVRVIRLAVKFSFNDVEALEFRIIIHRAEKLSLISRELSRGPRIKEEKT